VGPQAGDFRQRMLGAMMASTGFAAEGEGD